MGKRGGNGFWTITTRGGNTGHCIACRRPITYGERCEGCKQVLRQRKRRKPR
jgi:hypothetical protein